MAYDLIIRRGRVVTEQCVYAADVAVRDGRIAALADWDALPPAADEIDARGLLMLPGGVDPHVHFNEPGRGEWEGWEHGSRAAAAGGVTTVLEMPLNATPPVTTAAVFEAKQAVASRLSCVDFALWGGLVDDNIADLPGLEERGAIGYKAFLSDSGVDFLRAHDGILCEGLQFAARSGAVLGVHAENESITAHLAARLIAAGRTDRRAWGESRPPVQELEAINRLLFLAAQVGARVHVVHVSIAEGIDLIDQAKGAGQPVSAETCAHYLWFDEEDFIRIGPAAKCAPPIRSAANKEELWRRVLIGAVDCVASDHSPSDPALKHGDIWQAWGGIAGIQATLPVLLTEGVHRRGMPLELLARLWAGGAARIFGLYGRKGLIAPGADADLALVDPELAWTMTEEDLLGRHKVSPYVGARFRGKVVRTLVRGEQVFGPGVLPKHGAGRLVTREGALS